MDRASVWPRFRNGLQDENKSIPKLNKKYRHPDNAPYRQKRYRQCKIESSKPHNTSIKSTLQDVALLGQAARTYWYQLKKNSNRAMSGQTYDERNRLCRQRNCKKGFRDIRVDKVANYQSHQQMVNAEWTEEALLSVRSCEFYSDIETDNDCDNSMPKTITALRPPWSSTTVSPSMCNEGFGSGLTPKNCQRNKMFDRIDALPDKGASRKNKASEKGTPQADEAGGWHRTREGLITSAIPAKGTEGWAVNPESIFRLEEVETHVSAGLTAQGYIGLSQAKAQGREEGEAEE